MKHEEGTFEVVKDVKIFYQAWIPDVPKAIIQNLHGLNGHSGVIEYFPDLFNRMMS